MIYIDDLENMPILTFSSSYKRTDFEKPSNAYLDTIRKGILETYPDTTPEEIEKYFNEVIEKGSYKYE